MLEAARSALLDAGSADAEPARTGVVIGLGLDLRTTDFHLRWQTLEGGKSPLQFHYLQRGLFGRAGARDCRAGSAKRRT